MKRWQVIAEVGGFLIVLAFAAVRFLPARTSWEDLHDLSHDLMQLGLFILMNAAILLAIIAIFWGGYLFWRQIRPTPPKNRPAESQYSTGRVRHTVEIAVLSVVLGLTASGLTKMQTPGWWVASMLFSPGRDLNLGLFVVSAIVVDAGICFAILWGGYLLWTRSRQERTR
ncbi:MAG TPA: hypothetical protein VJX30_16960 [Terriglobales bacterium]|jgi:hypothetical protein|nr:hypothetical protein [Terriglobales bacterium]